ncbi:MAG: hypothetical protein WBR33_20395, partial [Pseudonocardiaceae bacterium]
LEAAVAAPALISATARRAAAAEATAHDVPGNSWQPSRYRSTAEIPHWKPISTPNSVLII